MKVRLGFVTNSSSSSFLLAFSKEGKMEEELLQENLPEEIYEILLEQIKSERKVSLEQVQSVVKEEITEEILVRRFIETMDYVDFKRKELNDEDQEAADRQYDAVMKALEGKNHFVFLEEYDDTEIGAELELRILPYLGITKAHFNHH